MTAGSLDAREAVTSGALRPDTRASGVSPHVNRRSARSTHMQKLGSKLYKKKLEAAIRNWLD